ncbi:4Fe-4S cluster-binding domain-containing protein [Bacteroides salyersiae]|uniref:4Fe-4S cluster-binding domain-containing protein n=1 Tax=Bacteroides salyersiae TaxID=291644 RepID=A0A7J4XJ46_9BACE|nr:4Fe-4S cluster-binding domain-containing protein [Bacteroides salyersiae]KAA3693971.1 4Fe-4S cluster-binding domain-containing protein [Bacteroides salyersiae]KAA3703184.1 4Fe-4S cluster-binding domain-containing protein [Bacteroides salyersiae]KAA3709258.1 4Fe-4S cluster-binding domain-containing protein [Bacteroides salyersiae]KAA3709856.1 4Fe-4S cluster-binding domain-containing protein [Bacteroides salyersiae]
MGIHRHRLLTDGEGVTTFVGFSGYPLRCKYCINKSCWEESGTINYTPAELYDEIKKGLIYLVATGGGVTFGGGEPGLQSKFRNLEKFAMDDYISTWKPL